MSGSLFSIDQKDVQKFNSGSGYGAPAKSSADAIFDSSGWSVATSGSKSSTETDRSSGLDLPPWMLIGVAAVLVVGWIRTAKR